MQVRGTLQCNVLSKLLLMLESALKIAALSPTCARRPYAHGPLLSAVSTALDPCRWPLNRESWRGRTDSANTPALLEESVVELEQAIAWQRILLTADGQARRAI